MSAGGSKATNWPRVCLIGSCRDYSAHLPTLASDRLSVAPGLPILCVCVCVCVCSVTQLCPTLFNPMNCSSQAPLSMGFPRQEYWSGLPFSSFRRASPPRDRTHICCVSWVAGGFFTRWSPACPVGLEERRPLGSDFPPCPAGRSLSVVEQWQSRGPILGLPPPREPRTSCIGCIQGVLLYSAQFPLLCLDTFLTSRQRPDSPGRHCEPRQSRIASSFWWPAYSVQVYHKLAFIMVIRNHIYLILPLSV